MNPISLAVHGKGIRKAIQRGLTIVGRYGFSSAKMERALAQYTDILSRFDCRATFPIISIAVQRHPELIKKYYDQGIEFAIHGLRHLDHSELTYEEQKAQLATALQIFEQAALEAKGFRGPYLRWSADTLTVLEEYSLLYDSSQSLTWDVLGEYDNQDYQHVLQFYGSRSATNYPSLPNLEDRLVRLPYSLPDDESLVERLILPPGKMNELWVDILHRTHRLGELFTIGLHPERISYCKDALEAVLSEAGKLQPAVWIARLDEIAAWWWNRTRSQVEIDKVSEGEFHVTVKGPEGVTVLARGVEVDAPTVPWSGSYQQVEATKFTIRAPRHPFVGLSPSASPDLVDFLRQQGYIIEFSSDRKAYAYYFDQPQFVARHKRFLLAQIEGANFPLVRLSRWPNGTRSALAITGDIDALTLWDYVLRLIGK